jgi:hypothetical protein
MPPLARAVLTLCLAWSVSACDDSCVDVNTSCTPLYEPTFDNVYTNTLAVSCAVGNGTCHTGDGASAGGLAFNTADSSYEALTGASQRAIASDAACSPMVVRVAGGGDNAMPPGKPLSAEERCAIVQWVQNGARR